jgi:hypothetical protein
MIFISKSLHREYGAITLLIVVVCVIYALLAFHIPPNSDERASLVIALGRHPSLMDSRGLPIPYSAYIDSLDHKMYPISGNSLLNTTRVVKDNGNGLVYYILLTIWIKLFGLNIFLARLLTILSAAITLGLIYRLAKYKGIFSGFRFLLILQIVVNPVFFTDAILVRSYMLATMGCMVSAVSLYHLYVKRSKSGKFFLFYFLGILIAFGSHFFTASLIAGMACILKWNNRKQFVPAVFWGYSVLFILAGAWIWYIYPDIDIAIKFFHDQFLVLSKGTGYEINIKNTVRQLLLYSANMFGMSSLIKTLGIFFKVVSMVLIFILIRDLYFRKNETTYRFLSALTVLPLILFIIQAYMTGNFFNFIPHYLVFFIPFWCILLFLKIQSQVMITRL